MKFREFKLRKDPECPVCGDPPDRHALIDYEQFCGMCRPRPQARRGASRATEITPSRKKKRRRSGDAAIIVDVREPNEFQINRIPARPDSARRAAHVATPELDPRANRRPLQDGRPEREGRGFLRSVGFKGVRQPAGRHPRTGLIRSTRAQPRK